MATKRITFRGPGMQIALPSVGGSGRKGCFIGNVLVFANKRPNNPGPKPRFAFIVEWSVERRETLLNARQLDRGGST